MQVDSYLAFPPFPYGSIRVKHSSWIFFSLPFEDNAHFLSNMTGILWAHARQQQHFFAFLSFFLLCLCDSFGMFSLKKTLLCPAHRYKLNIFVWKAKRIKAVHCSSSILYNTRHSSGHGAKLRGIRDDRIPSIKSTFGERGKFFLSCSCHVRVWFRLTMIP